MALMKGVFISPLKMSMSVSYMQEMGDVMEATRHTAPRRYVFSIPEPSASFILSRICLRQQVPPMALLLG